MIASQAGNYKKKTSRELKILIKDRRHPLPHNARPTDNHQILQRSHTRPCARSRKKPAQVLRIVKKEGVTTQQLQKKFGSDTEDYKK